MRGRIQVNNTLEDRIELGYQEFLPDIRAGLFPDYK
jgi:vacuolar-type H+-ATPase subunit E/Vma4